MFLTEFCPFRFGGSHEKPWFAIKECVCFDWSGRTPHSEQRYQLQDVHLQNGSIFFIEALENKVASWLAGLINSLINQTIKITSYPQEYSPILPCNPTWHMRFKELLLLLTLFLGWAKLGTLQNDHNSASRRRWLFVCPDGCGVWTWEMLNEDICRVACFILQSPARTCIFLLHCPYGWFCSFYFECTPWSSSHCLYSTFIFHHHLGIP